MSLSSDTIMVMHIRGPGVFRKAEESINFPPGYSLHLSPFSINSVYTPVCPHILSSI